MADRRVNVTLSIPTDADATEVLSTVLESVRKAPAYDNNLLPIDVETASVHAFDLDDDAEKEAPHNPVHLVVDPASGVVQAYTDDRRAHEYASNLGAVVVELPITSDYRAPATA